MSEPRIIRHGVVNLDDYDASLSAKNIARRSVEQTPDDVTPGQMIHLLMATIEEIREHASIGRLVEAEAKIARSGEPSITHEELVRRLAQKDAEREPAEKEAGKTASAKADA